LREHERRNWGKEALNEEIEEKGELERNEEDWTK